MRRLAPIAPETPSEGENGKLSPQSGRQGELAKAKTTPSETCAPAPPTGTECCHIAAGTGLTCSRNGKWYYVLMRRTGFCYKAYVSCLPSSAGIPRLNTRSCSPLRDQIKRQFRKGPLLLSIIRAEKGRAVKLSYRQQCAVKYGDEYGYLRKDYVKLNKAVGSECAIKPEAMRIKRLAPYAHEHTGQSVKVANATFRVFTEFFLSRAPGANRRVERRRFHPSEVRASEPESGQGSGVQAPCGGVCSYSLRPFPLLRRRSCAGCRFPAERRSTPFRRPLCRLELFEYLYIAEYGQGFIWRGRQIQASTEIP